MELRRPTCKEAIGILADYLDSALGPELLAALEGHLRDCPPCVAYVNTYKETRALTGEVGRVDMPEEMKRRLRQLLLDQLTGGSA